MGVAFTFVHKYVAPALAGLFIAAATAAGNITATLALMGLGLISGYMSMPAGGRLLARIGKTDS